MLGALVALVAGLVVANTTTTQLSESRRDAVATVPLTDEVNLTHGPTAEVTSDHAAPTPTRTGAADAVSVAGRVAIHQAERLFTAATGNARSRACASR